MLRANAEGQPPPLVAGGGTAWLGPVARLLEWITGLMVRSARQLQAPVAAARGTGAGRPERREAGGRASRSGGSWGSRWLAAVPAVVWE